MAQRAELENKSVTKNKQTKACEKRVKEVPKNPGVLPSEAASPQLLCGDGDKLIHQPALGSALCVAVKVIAAVKLEPAEESTSGSPGVFSWRDGTSWMFYLIRENTPTVTWWLQINWRV